MKQETMREAATQARRGGVSAPLRVEDVMTHDSIALSPDQSFAELVGLMASRPFHHVLVVDGEERLHGVISDRDVLRAMSRISDWNKKMVSEVMSRDSITTTPDTAISAALKIMLDKRINCLPVLGADQRVCGILTSTDLLRAYQTVQEKIEFGAD